MALTLVDIMVQWKMSCQLMEELPVAAGRSVATGAMCVNLLPCHFFCLSPHSPPSPSPFISTFFSFPFHPPPLPSRLHSLYLHSLCDKLLLAVDLLVVKSAPCAGMEVGRAGEEVCSPPPPPTHTHTHPNSTPPPSHLTPVCRHHSVVSCLSGN